MKKGDLLKFKHDNKLTAIVVKGPYAAILKKSIGPKQSITEESIVVDIIVEGKIYTKIKIDLLDKINEQSK